MLVAELHIPPGEANNERLHDFYVDKLGFSAQVDGDDSSIEYFAFGDFCLHMYTRQGATPHPYFGHVSESKALGQGVEIVNVVEPNFDLHSYWESVQQKLNPESIAQPLRRRNIASYTGSLILYHDFRLC